MHGAGLKVGKLRKQIEDSTGTGSMAGLDAVIIELGNLMVSSFVTSGTRDEEVAFIKLIKEVRKQRRKLVNKNSK